MNIEKEIDIILEDSKAQDIIKIPVSHKTSLCDYMYIASGTSSRHIKSIADNVIKRFKELGMQNVPTEGKGGSSWMVIDLGDAIIHIFQNEVREQYKLEEIWK